MHNPVPNTIAQSHHSPHLANTTTQTQNNQDLEQTTLNIAINYINLGNPPVPNTPFNSPTLSPPHPPLQEPNNVQNPLPNQPFGASFALRPPWFPTKSSILRWSWIGEKGPFITTGLLQDSQYFVSDTESESSMAILSNLDSLNRDRLEVLPTLVWNKGHIPESLDSIVEALICRVKEIDCVLNWGNKQGPSTLSSPNPLSGPNL